jgi:hypothetical protein
LSPARRSTIYLGALGAGILLFALVFVHASRTVTADGPFIKERARLVGEFGLTDLCLFTDARYTRNPAVADGVTPFQDHPMSLEHFPSGSIIGPPKGVRHGLD